MSIKNCKTIRIHLTLYKDAVKTRKGIFLNPKFVNLASLPQPRLFVCLYKLLPIEKKIEYIFLQ